MFFIKDPRVATIRRVSNHLLSASFLCELEQLIQSPALTNECVTGSVQQACGHMYFILFR